MLGHVKAWLKEQKMSVAKRHLEHRLSGIIEIANGHKDADLPAGHEYYKILLGKARTYIGMFSREYEVSESDILVSMPAMRELEGLAAGETSGGVPEQAGKIFGAALFGSAIVTAVVAFDHNLYLGLTYWCTRHWMVH